MAQAAAPRFWWVRMHELGALQVGMANFGGIGWGGLNCQDEFYAGVHFPKGTRNAFLGADIWIGGRVDQDTLVSVTNDPDWILRHDETHEFNTRPYPEGLFDERTSWDVLELGEFCPPVPFSADAVSEHDLITVSWDTLADVQYTGINRLDGRPHLPLGLELTQQSYSWSYEYARDFVIVEYRLKNIGRPAARGIDALHIHDMFVGILGWGGVYHDNRGQGNDSIPEVQDDLIGFLRTAPLPGYPDLQDSLDVVWFADNDGNPRAGAFGDQALPSAFGLRVLQAPAQARSRSFNWWVGHRDPALDWGPVRRGHATLNPTGGLGWPLTDRAKYAMMSNGEIDYPQIETAISHEGSGWLPPPAHPGWAADIADGQHTWCLLSFGPFDLAPNDSVTFTIAAIGGEQLHTDPTNFAVYFEPADPTHYLTRLDFSDLVRNAQWAAWIYDAPGLDTDRDGNAGPYHVIGTDTVYYRGDGVPDFKGPPPPPSPGLTVTAERARAIVRWNGERSQTQLDPFSNRADFEGYRVYMSRTGLDHDFALVAQRDRVNYSRHTWSPEGGRWETKDPPFDLDTLRVLYDSLSRVRYGHAFHPDSFSSARLDKAFLELRINPLHPARLDTTYRHFSPYLANHWPDDRALADAVEQGVEIEGVIRKLYPEARPGDSARRTDGTLYRPFYEYEFALSGLQISEPVFFSVTAFDHGDPSTGVMPQESSPSVNMRDVWPVESATRVRETRPRPGVYPNPYRLADRYNAAGWENTRGLEPDPERARKVTFYDVPDTCTVSIWSLDGDLVRRIEHRADPGRSDASVVVWNLITRNTQAVKTGIYIWSVESRLGTDIGKLVVIK
jgi:hypothetical protein